MAARKFTTAASDGDLEVVKSLLTEDIDGELLECIEDEGNTALICACANGREKIVRHLLGKGAKLDSFNNYGWTALMAASYYGHLSIVTTLLQHNTSKPNYVNRLCCGALHCASRCNNIQVAELLILKGAQVNINEDMDTRWYMSPLMTAVKHGHDAIVTLLLSKGADVNFRDEVTGWTPLMLASLKGHTTAVQTLIKSGANCNELNHLGQSALDIAKKWKRKDVENMLERIRTIRARDAGNPKVDINVVEAARQGNLGLIKELSRNDDFNVNETEQDGMTPLMCAAAGNHVEVLQFFIDKKADVNVRDKKRGWTALMHATVNSHKSIICLLLLSEAEVQLKAFDGFTAFDLATVIGDSEIIRILVAGDGVSTSDSHRKFVQQMLNKSLQFENKSVTWKYDTNGKQVSDISETNRQGLKVLVSKGLNKLWNFNRTVRYFNKKQTTKSRSFQANINDMSGQYQINIDSVKNSNILSGNITNGEQISTVMLESVMVDGIDQKKVTRLPLIGPSLNLWSNELSSPVIPPFTPATTLDFSTKQRGVSESLSTSPQVPLVFLNDSVHLSDGDKTLKKSQLNSNLDHDSDYYSADSKLNSQMSPVLLNQEGQSPDSSFSFSTANSPNSSFTCSTNTRGHITRKEGWNSSNFPSQYYQNRSKHAAASSLPSCSPPLGFSVSPTHHYLVPKPPTVKRKANSLPRIGRSSVAPVYNPVKSEPDDEQMKRLLAKLSLEKYTPIFEEHEVDMESFVTLNEGDLDEIGIDQDDAKEQILAAVTQLRNQKEKKHSFYTGIQTEAWS